MKGIGYFISIVSVFLLAAPAWKGASEDPTLRACLILGMAASIAGMALRWMAARRQARKLKDTREQIGVATSTGS